MNRILGCVMAGYVFLVLMFFQYLKDTWRFDVAEAVAICNDGCFPDKAAWRYDGQALACACDDLDVQIPKASRRIK